LELLAKARSGQDLTRDERQRVRAITERRQRAQMEEGKQDMQNSRHEQNAAGAADVRGASAPRGAVAASSNQRGAPPPPPPANPNAPPIPPPPAAAKMLGVNSKIRVTEKVSAKEELEIEKLLALTRAYFNLVQKQVVDLVPKYIQLLLVEEPKELIIKSIGALTDKQVAELMAPSPDVTKRREETAGALKKLREAEQMLFDVGQMDTIGNRF
jgi:hypothetical protein